MKIYLLDYLKNKIFESIKTGKVLQNISME